MTETLDAPVAYTKWIVATGEILESGVSGNPTAGPDEGLFIGAEYSAETHYFDPATGDPILRTSPRELSQQELETAVNRERTRRIEAGKVIDGVMVTGRDQDRANLSDLAFGAQLRMMAGDNSTVTLFRDGNNVDHELTTPQIISLWQQSAAYVSALYAASWALKAMQPIPQNCSDNSLWPSIDS